MSDLFAPGVYFGLAAEAYHADPALGSTSLKRLLTSGPDFWWNSPMNPARPEDGDDTPSLIFGRAVHAMVLEGREALDAVYERAPDPEGLLVTDEHMVAWLDANQDAVALLGEKVPRSKAGKAALIARLDPTARILDFIRAAAEGAGRIILPAEQYDRIVAAATMIRTNPALVQAFSGGVSEVSVFWDHDLGDGEAPIRCKARFDHLKVRAIGDLKSIRNIGRRPFIKACCNAIAVYGYDVQAAHYMEGRAELPRLVAAGKVFGEHDPEWLARVAASEETAFVFVFYQADSAPIAWGTQLSPGNPILEIGRTSADHALWTFADFRKRFGPEAAWVLTDPISELDLNDLPAWYGR